MFQGEGSDRPISWEPKLALDLAIWKSLVDHDRTGLEKQKE